MKLKSLNSCRLAIGSYPAFHYDARGGGGIGRKSIKKKGEIQCIDFDPKDFSIPSLNWRSARIGPLPIPPGIEIKMILNKLKGSINEITNYISLDFEAEFELNIWPDIKFSRIFIRSCLHSGDLNTKLHSVRGINIQKDGYTRLVGKANVQRTGDRVLDNFLGLPNEALAVLECQLSD